MQQRGTTTTVDSEEGKYPSSTPPSRSRQNSKPKVLVRSHAMREETSPPREPSPNNPHHHHPHPPHQLPPSPRIELVPSQGAAALSPALTLSPSLNSPSGRVVSPAALVPPPNGGGSVELEPSDGEEEGRFVTSSPKFTNELNNSKNEESKQASHSFKKKYVCDCQNQNCLKCVNAQERNINNNLTNVNNNVMGSPNMLSVSEACGRRKLRQQSSSLGSFESSSMSPCLSRDSSSDQYTDTTGIDLEMFIPETLNRNAKDRALMLRIEQELVNLAKDTSKTHYKFPPMSSYQRMLVHRCAAYFGMDHNIEPTGKSVVVNKTLCTRIPKVGFRKHIKEDIIFSEEPRRSILKRDSSSIEDYSFKSPDRSYGSENRRSKSFEEREEEYEKVRRRIFREQMHDGSSEDFGWPEIPWSSTESDCSTRYRLQPPDIHRRQMGKLMKGHSEETGEAQRPCVAKSYSFGGYGGGVSVLSRGDSVMSTHSAGPRLLTKQDSGASSVSWRLSPSSSGYKSQSQMSDSVTPSPTSTPHPLTEGENSEKLEAEEGSDRHVVWAVTDMQNVPKGSIIINPQTGKPLKNEDGSLYHYDPHNPPPGMGHPATKPPPSPHKPAPKEIQCSPKKTRPAKSSPTHKSTLTNSSTSPSLPFCPPATAAPPPQRSYPYAQTDSVGGTPQQFGGYHGGYAQPPAIETAPVYSPPYVVYTAPYGVQVQQQYDNRMDGTAIAVPTQDLATYILNEAEQSTNYLNQHLASQNIASAQRYVPLPLTAAAHPGYPPHGIPPYQGLPLQFQMNQSDIIPVYPNQPRQQFYQNQPNTAYILQSQPAIFYSANPVYSPHYPPPQIAPQQMPSYPQGTPTPNSCISSASGHAPPNSGHDVMQVAQGIQQLSLATNMQDYGHKAAKGPMQQQYDNRQRGGNNNYFKGKPMVRNPGSNQSSTGTNSPAATVIPGCSLQNHTGMYRMPEPAQFPFTTNFSAPPNFSTPPMMYRQMSNPGACSSATMTCSRSTTPANDVAHFEKLPPNFYQHVPVEHMLIHDRGQPNMCGQPAPEMMKQMGYNNGPFRNRKTKNTRTSSLPPSGK